MNTQEFGSFLAGIFSDLRRITTTKGREYANDDDQLANFRRLGRRLGVPPEVVVLVYLTKHLDAIEHAARVGGTLSEDFRGRCLDAVLYLILLAALRTEGDAERATATARETPRAATGGDPPTRYPTGRGGDGDGD